ncbi:MAG: hypothetical protein M3Q47_15800 [Actinomycetota bacterium]|nr:hypothetical protein [Actinomycetota bacterium]
MTAITTPPTSPPATVARRATLATAGAVLWVLLPAAWAVTGSEEQPSGALSSVAVAVSDWVFLVLAPALLVVGHAALRTALGPAAGRVGTTGIVLAALGLGAMAVGNGIEVASITTGGGEVAAGHALFLVGFPVSIVGGLLAGVTVIRKRRDALSRIAGWVLVLALPLGIGIGVMGSVLAPGNDAGFWAAIAIPPGSPGCCSAVRSPPSPAATPAPPRRPPDRPVQPAWSVDRVVDAGHGRAHGAPARGAR